MKFKLMLYLILISYINLSNIISMNEIFFSPKDEYKIPLTSIIDPENKYYILYFLSNIYIFDYKNNKLQDTLLATYENWVKSFEINKNYSIFIISGTNIYIITIDKGISSYDMNNFNNLCDVFSIDDIEDEWRIVQIDITKKIKFHNYIKYKINYLASFNPNFDSFDDIKCKYYNSKVYCIIIDSINIKFKFYIIPIDKITNSNELTISDIDYYSESEIEGKFINIYTFPNSEPLITYSFLTQKFISNFKGEKIEIENSNIIFSNNTFIIKEINEYHYYSCDIKSDNKKIILCNIIPYSQNIITANNVNLESDIYESDIENEYLINNKDNNGFIITRIDKNRNFHLIKIEKQTLINYMEIIENVVTEETEENSNIYEEEENSNIISEETDLNLVYEEVRLIFNDIISDTYSYISDEPYEYEYSKCQVYYYSDSSSIETVSNDNKLSVAKFNNEMISSIKELNNIDENNDIIIIKIDIKTDNYPIPSVLLSIIDEYGNILKVPDSSNFTIEKPILNSKNLNIEKAYKLKQKSIDIYDISHPFYNDICFPFTSEINGQDIPIKDRRNEYYVNITFCEKNCNFSYFDYINMKVVCDCNSLSQIDDFEVLSFLNLKNAFLTHLINFNYKVIKCYNLVFNKNNYKNLGTIFIFMITILSIICSILYIKYHNMEPVKNALKKLEPKDKNKIESSSMEKIGKNNNFKKDNFFITNESKNNFEIINTEKTSSDFRKEELKNNLTPEEITNKEKKIKGLKYNLGKLKYEDALIFDKRSIKQKYWDYLLQSQLILSHFYADLILELRYIKIIALLINLALQFFFNCFFYTDECISDIYHRNGVISFFSDLPKVIYSILMSFFINTVLNFLSFYEDDLIEIVFNENNNKIYWEKSNKVLHNFYYRINVFVGVVIVFELFFLYYCTAFCAVYPNNQLLLLFSFFQDLIINLLLPFILCFIIAIFKHLSIQKRMKTLFCVVGYLDYLL